MNLVFEFKFSQAQELFHVPEKCPPKTNFCMISFTQHSWCRELGAMSGITGHWPLWEGYQKRSFTHRHPASSFRVVVRWVCMGGGHVIWKKNTYRNSGAQTKRNSPILELGWSSGRPFLIIMHDAYMCTLDRILVFLKSPRCAYVIQSLTCFCTKIYSVLDIIFPSFIFWIIRASLAFGITSCPKWCVCDPPSVFDVSK